MLWTGLDKKEIVGKAVEQHVGASAVLVRTLDGAAGAVKRSRHWAGGSRRKQMGVEDFRNNHFGPGDVDSHVFAVDTMLTVDPELHVPHGKPGQR